MADLQTLARDAAFTAVGFGVLAAQQVSVRRFELQKQVGRLTEGGDDRRKLVEERLEGLAEQVLPALEQLGMRVSEVLDDLEGQVDRLLEPVRDLLRTSH